MFNQSIFFSGKYLGGRGDNRAKWHQRYDLWTFPNLFLLQQGNTSKTLNIFVTRKF